MKALKEDNSSLQNDWFTLALPLELSDWASLNRKCSNVQTEAQAKRKSTKQRYIILKQCHYFTTNVLLANPLNEFCKKWSLYLQYLWGLQNCHSNHITEVFHLHMKL